MHASYTIAIVSFFPLNDLLCSENFDGKCRLCWTALKENWSKHCAFIFGAFYGMRENHLGSAYLKLEIMQTHLNERCHHCTEINQVFFLDSTFQKLPCLKQQFKNFFVFMHQKPRTPPISLQIVMLHSWEMNDKRLQKKVDDFSHW